MEKYYLFDGSLRTIPGVKSLRINGKFDKLYYEV